MRILGHRNIIFNNIMLKLLSLTLGFIIWSIMNQSHITTFKLEIPLVFYNVSQNSTIVAPEQISIGLQGTKKILRTLATQSIAAHIDAQTLKYGDNLISISKATLFLPDHIQLIDTAPSPVVVTVKSSKKDRIS